MSNVLQGAVDRTSPGVWTRHAYRAEPSSLFKMNGATEFEVAIDQTPAPRPEANFAQLVEGILADADISAPASVILQIEKLADRESFKRAGEALHKIVSSLRDTPAARGLQRALLGANGSLGEDAKAVKCSRQAIHKHEKRFRKSLERLTTKPLVEDENDFSNSRRKKRR